MRHKKGQFIYTLLALAFSFNVQSTPPQMLDTKGVEVESKSYIDKPLIAETIKTVPVKRQGTGSHSFAPGNCTAYVASKRSIPWSGNAKDWLANAKSYGYSIGDTPKVGAIVVTSESKSGHVALIDEVEDNQIELSEMNYKGLGVISTRTISTDSPFIKGYIY